MDQATHNKIVSFIWGIAGPPAGGRGGGMKNVVAPTGCIDEAAPLGDLRTLVQSARQRIATAA